MIYADNAATTKPSKAALDAFLPYLSEYYGNPSSGHSMGVAAFNALSDSRRAIKECLHADEDGRIIFLSGGSEANAQAIYSAAMLGKKQGKKRIITTEIEHDSVYNTVKKLEDYGFEAVFIRPDRNGIICAEDVERSIDSETFLVSVMAANNEIGTVQQIAEIGEICRKNDVIFHCDGVSAVGHCPIDVAEMKIDMLSMSAHKFGGVKGAGALYVRGGIAIAPIISGGNQESGLRAGTENVPAIAAMAAALKDSLERFEEKRTYTESLRDRLICRLLQIENTVLNGSLANRLSGNVNISFGGINAEALLLILDSNGICASKGSACKTHSEEPSRVLSAIGRENEIALGTLRFSLSCENTAEEIDIIAETVKKAVNNLR